MASKLSALVVAIFAVKADSETSISGLIHGSTRIGIVHVAAATRKGADPLPASAPPNTYPCIFDLVVDLNIRGAGSPAIRLKWMSDSQNCESPLMTPSSATHVLAFMNSTGDAYSPVGFQPQAMKAVPGYREGKRHLIDEWRDPDLALVAVLLSPDLILEASSYESQLRVASGPAISAVGFAKSFRVIGSIYGNGDDHIRDSIALAFSPLGLCGRRLMVRGLLSSDKAKVISRFEDGARSDLETKIHKGLPPPWLPASEKQRYLRDARDGLHLYACSAAADVRSTARALLKKYFSDELSAEECIPCE